MTYCIYGHFRADNETLFYIGISKGEKRAFDEDNRNRYWHFTVKKYGYSVRFLHNNLAHEEAIQKEVELIKQYGRKNNKTGILVNLTDGGEGKRNYITPEETKDKIRASLTGKKLSLEHRLNISKAGRGIKRSEETRARMSAAQKGRRFSPETISRMCKAQKGNQNFLGKKHSEETKNYLRALHIGKKMTSEQNMKNSLAQKNLYANGYISPNKGKTITNKQRIAISNAQSRKVIDTVTGEIFKSIRYASISIGVKYETLYAKLSGRNNNNTNLKFY